ncbi:tail fiber domain-containing protein [Bacteriovorax sp. PP10]|uniref:Tail fiber domain-containing protein n=1 Tax=Bacteriovorax antarcticus TaxID=3088717 RepID=A0ABU5VX99_9BACT|nr:tail fiber domain-containing protein [Bacteriovorax sp. PP10]MEA9357686.1 tail fiber domain-containing protein [Bacteriovorax sp. PP10]
MKVNQKKIFIILVSALATAGCVPVGKKFAIEFKDPSAFTNLKLDVSSVQVQNNQLIVRGAGLKDIKTIKLVNNGVTETLVVESATSGQLVANGLSAIAIGVGKVFDMVLTDAYGSATMPVTFTLENGSIMIAHLSDMGATAGQVLKYNGTVWEPSTLSSSQVYQGVWNANTNTPNINLTSPVSGEYYIVTVAGIYNTVAFDVGDWIIHNGTGWDKIVSAAANKLSLSGGTLTGNLQLDTLLKFKGASNYVSLKASSSLASDIVLVLPKTLGTSGQFLTTDGTGVMSWTTPVDPVIDNLDATQIADGSVTSAAFQYLAGATSNIQAQLNAKQATGNFVTALTGDVTASGAGSVTATVTTVGGATAANIAAGTALANAATNANTASTIIKRDASGNFSAGTITGTFNGSATNVSGTVAVANGGTGNTTLGVNQLLFGNGTSAINGLPTTAIPAVLLSTVASGAPTWTTSTTGNVLKGSVSGVSFGALDSSDLPTGTLSGAGTANYVPYYNTTSTLANSPMAISGNNVGIGTTTPGAIFEVSSTSPSLRISNPNVTISDFSTTGFSPTLGANTTAQWVNYSNTTGGYQLAGFTKSGTNNGVPAALVGYHGGTAPTTAAILLSGWKWNGATTRAALASSEIVTQVANATTPLMTVLGSGYVGVGTATPQKLLHVLGNAGTDFLFQVESTAASNDANFLLLADQNTGATNFSMRHGTSAGAGWNFGMNPAEHFTITSRQSSTNTDRLTILNTGNVGIGTTAPTQKLSVAGTYTTDFTGNDIVFSRAGAPSYISQGGIGGNLLFLSSYATAKDTNALALLANGNFGIGMTTPNASLYVNKTSPTGTISSTLTDVVGVGTNFTAAFRVGDQIVSSGQVKTITAITDATNLTVNTAFSTDLAAVAYARVGAVFYAGNVGIGTSSAIYPLDVVGDIRSTTNLRVGSGSAGISTTGNDITLKDALNNTSFRGTRATSSWSDSANTQWFQVGNSGDKVTFSAAAGSAAGRMKVQTASFQVATSSGSNVPTGLFEVSNNTIGLFNVLSSGNVGIGTTAPSTLLHVKTTTAGATVATFESGTGSCTIVPNSGMSCSSDIRLKENFEEIINGLDKVLNLRGVTFQWKERSLEDDSRHMGFIAQEVEKVAPELVTNDARGYKRVNYANFVAVLTEAVKDLFHKWFNDSQGLHREIASVKAESAQLKKNNELLKEENKAIKSYLCSRDPNAEICK